MVIFWAQYDYICFCCLYKHLSTKDQTFWFYYCQFHWDKTDGYNLSSHPIEYSLKGISKLEHWLQNGTAIIQNILSNDKSSLHFPCTQIEYLLNFGLSFQHFSHHCNNNNIKLCWNNFYVQGLHISLGNHDLCNSSNSVQSQLLFLHLISTWWSSNLYTNWLIDLQKQFLSGSMHMG